VSHGAVADELAGHIIWSVLPSLNRGTRRRLPATGRPISSWPHLRCGPTCARLAAAFGVGMRHGLPFAPAQGLRGITGPAPHATFLPEQRGPERGERVQDCRADLLAGRQPGVSEHRGVPTGG
jgi:hypothetical protein